MRLCQVTKIVVCVIAIMLVSRVAGSNSVLVETDSVLMEMLMIFVDCNNASAETMITVISDNDTLTSFPSSVDLGAPHLDNATTVSAMSSPSLSILMYGFENISEGDAETNADIVTPSISSAFGVSFTHESTWTNDTTVYVNYTGPGQSDMTGFVNSMLSECIHEDVHGFTDAIPNLATKTPESSFGLTATKEVGNDWLLGVIAMSNSTIPTGSNSHTIDVLELLDVSSLAPSPLSFNASEDYYTSLVWLTFDCDPSVTFISCVPPELAGDLSERGWVDMLFAYGFFFGNESSPVETLTLTFGGTVIPEFTPVSSVIAALSIAACLIAFKWRIGKRIHQPR